MDNKEKQKRWSAQEWSFSPSQFELILELYWYWKVEFDSTITGLSDQAFGRWRQVTPETILIAKWLIEKEVTSPEKYRLTYSWFNKMEEIKKIANMNLIQRWMYKLNKYPVIISLISAIIWAIIGIYGWHSTNMFINTTEPKHKYKIERLNTWHSEYWFSHQNPLFHIK